MVYFGSVSEEQRPWNRFTFLLSLFLKKSVRLRQTSRTVLFV